MEQALDHRNRTSCACDEVCWVRCNGLRLEPCPRCAVVRLCGKVKLHIPWLRQRTSATQHFGFSTQNVDAGLKFQYGAPMPKRYMTPLSEMVSRVSLTNALALRFSVCVNVSLPVSPLYVGSPAKCSPVTVRPSRLRDEYLQTDLEKLCLICFTTLN